MITFAINSRTSFNNVKLKWRNELDKLAPGIPYILVGTKGDIRNSGNQSDLISRSQAEALKDEIKAFKYIECSALTQENLKVIAFYCFKCYILKFIFMLIASF